MSNPIEEIAYTALGGVARKGTALAGQYGAEHSAFVAFRRRINYLLSLASKEERKSEVNKDRAGIDGVVTAARAAHSAYVDYEDVFGNIRMTIYAKIDDYTRSDKTRLNWRLNEEGFEYAAIMRYEEYCGFQGKVDNLHAAMTSDLPSWYPHPNLPPKSQHHQREPIAELLAALRHAYEDLSDLINHA